MKRVNLTSCIPELPSHLLFIKQPIARRISRYCRANVQNMRLAANYAVTGNGRLNWHGPIVQPRVVSNPRLHYRTDSTEPAASNL